METENQITACKTYLNYPRIIVTNEFIERNKLSLKSQEEIYNHIKNDIKGDLFAFDKEVYITFLPFELAKDWLTPEYIKMVENGEAEKFEETPFKESVQDFLDYMNFAWGKAEDERGISAIRSVQKLGAYLYCFNRIDLSELIHDDDLYNPYGAPALIEVCNQLGITVPNSLVEFAKHKC